MLSLWCLKMLITFCCRAYKRKLVGHIESETIILKLNFRLNKTKLSWKHHWSSWNTYHIINSCELIVNQCKHHVDLWGIKAIIFKATTTRRQSKKSFVFLTATGCSVTLNIGSSIYLELWASSHKIDDEKF